MTWLKDIAAWKETLTDVFVGTVINFPLNLLAVWVIFEMQMSVLQSSVLIWAMFTIVAIIRKYCLRIYFKKKVANK